MRKILYILRHAKAEFAEDHAEDHVRSLSARGVADATRLGAYLRTVPAPVQYVLCSTATRTRQTHAALALNAHVDFSERLYLAHASEVLACVNALPASIDTALIVAHNPGMHELAALLIYDAANEHDTERLREKFPTCALAILSFDLPWHEIMPDSARLEGFLIPGRE